MKQLGNSLSLSLTSLINLSFPTCKFSSVLKPAKVIPIHKKGNKTECNNHKSISLYPTSVNLLLIFAYISGFKLTWIFWITKKMAQRAIKILLQAENFLHSCVKQSTKHHLYTLQTWSQQGKWNSHVFFHVLYSFLLRK